MPWARARDEPWCHVLAIFSLLARPPQIVWAPRRTGARGRIVVSHLGVPTPARFDGERRTGLQACEAKPSRGEATSQWPTAASWWRSFQTLGSNQGNRGRMGTSGSCYGSRVHVARCFRSFGPLLQSIPRPWGVMEYRNGIGAHRQDGAGAAKSEDRDDLALQHTPRAIVGGRRGVFSCGFPRLG